MVGVGGHNCYGRATRVIDETDFARKFATLAVLPPLLLHERLDYGTPGLHTGGKKLETGHELTLGAPRTSHIFAKETALKKTLKKKKLVLM